MKQENKAGEAFLQDKGVASEWRKQEEAIPRCGVVEDVCIVEEVGVVVKSERLPKAKEATRSTLRRVHQNE